MLGNDKDLDSAINYFLEMDDVDLDDAYDDWDE